MLDEPPCRPHYQRCVVSLARDPRRHWTVPLGGLAGALARVILTAMTKRVVAAFLWFYTGWYAGAMIAAFIGINPAIGPIVGVAAAGLVIVDPRQMFWARPAQAVVAPAGVEAAPEAA